MKTSEEKNTQIQSALDVLEGEGRVFTKQKNHVYGVMAYTYFTFIVLEILSMEFMIQRFKEILDRTLISWYIKFCYFR